MWVLTIFGFKISGSHYNPAISLAFMFRKDIGHFPRPLGIAYIVAQFLGGFGGALISWFLTSGNGGMITLTGGYPFLFQGIVTEVLGTFVVVFFFLT